MEDDFRNLTAKVWANLDNPIKRYDFSKVSLILCMSPSQLAQYNCLMELYTNLYKISLFMKMHLPSSFILIMLGLRWMCMHLWLNLIKRPIDIQEKLKIVKIYVQGQWRVVLLWYHIFWQSSIQRGRHTQLCIITSLKWIIKICSNFYWWVSKMLPTHPIHIVVWGNFPFKFFVAPYIMFKRRVWWEESKKINISMFDLYCYLTCIASHLSYLAINKATCL